MRTAFSVFLLVVLVVSLTNARIVTGGGYIGVDSTETSDPWCPAYNWIDASSGTDYFSAYADDGNATQPSPFAVKFFDVNYSTGISFHACTNGWVSFTSNSTIYNNTTLPNSGEPYTSICLYWDDLVYRVSETPHSHIYNYVDGSAPNRIWCIAFMDVYGMLLYTDPGSFQVQIFEEPSGSPYNNTIEFHYLDTNFEGTSQDSGISATVGMQDSSGTEGILYSFTEGIVSNNLAIRFVDEDRPYTNIQPVSLGNLKAIFH